ncbi:helix-turn-helix domain-containing protein [Arthrobacter sp. GMC3]|uniref:winged helix-turn-helix transcriptional regulator n=1 Tax=Arthrobacter sp. GMC3 TaxID=2058894 RepID=UPI000CE3A1C8|nr:helix-turn-helix domain-containing protein [Arthrobacter sp. GMC3]
MVLRSDWSTRPCPIARGINAVGDPWVLLILRELVAGVHRFDQIREQVGAADNILAKRLKYMVEEGLAVRAPYQDGRARRFEYFPTQAGADTLPILHAYTLWAQKHTPSEGHENRLSIICRSCQLESSSGEACSHCGATLTTANVSWIRPTYEDHRPRPLTKSVASLACDEIVL